MISSCVKSSSNISKTDKIQLWHYDSERNLGYQKRIVEIAKEYCERKNIPLELYVYNENTMTVEDYILKRNLALAFGNSIIIDDLRTMEDLINQNADYTKLVNYNSLFNSYKDRFCIPLGVDYLTIVVENEAIEYYDINTSSKSVITYSEYLEIKQQMKDKGARFEFNGREFIEIVDYYLNMNKLLFVDKNSKIIKDGDKFKEALKKTIIDICNDIILYSDANLTMSNKIVGSISNSRIYDKNSKMILCNTDKFVEGIVNPYEYEKIGGFANKTFTIYPYLIGSSPCFYMHKKITNDKIYDLANYIVDESSYFKIIGSDLKNTCFVPVLNTKNIREVLHVDDNWQVKVKENKEKLDATDEILAKDEIKKIINSVYDIIVKNEDTSKEVADYYFYYTSESRKNIGSFIQNSIMNISQKLSGNQLSLEKFDSENKEIIKMINDEINEFVTNFYLHNN